MENIWGKVIEEAAPGAGSMDLAWMTSFWESFCDCAIELNAQHGISHVRQKADSSLAMIDTVGKPFLDLMVEKDRGFAADNLERLKTNVVQYVRFQALSKLGRYYRWTLIAKIEDGAYAGCHGVSVDVTEQVTQKKNLEEARKAAEAANIAKSEFLSRMSHEIRTPMNAIIGMIHIGMGTDDVDRKNYCFMRAENATNHLLSLVNDILDMSKIEANKFELSYQAFDFKNTLRNIANIMSIRAEEKQLDFILNLGRDVPVMLMCDELRLSQVISNLLANAIKFTPEKGCVTLSIEKIEEMDDDIILRIEVADTGIGISKGQQEQIFMPFDQADASIRQNYGGTGLGLSISKQIVEFMGGKIWIESELGKGSKFIFTVKAKKVAGMDAESWESSDDAKHDASEHKYDFRHHTIMAVEDVEINREIMAAILEETGVSIEYAENGKIALSMFRANPGKYDLVLMDINMPEMDGYEATRQIRALDSAQAKDVPIIAMTANVFKEDIEKCLASGMNGHTGKPIDAKVLLEQLNKYLTTEEETPNG